MRNIKLFCIVLSLAALLLVVFLRDASNAVMLVYQENTESVLRTKFNFNAALESYGKGIQANCTDDEVRVAAESVCEVILAESKLSEEALGFLVKQYAIGEVGGSDYVTLFPLHWYTRFMY